MKREVKRTAAKADSDASRPAPSRGRKVLALVGSAGAGFALGFLANALDPFAQFFGEEALARSGLEQVYSGEFPFSVDWKKVGLDYNYASSQTVESVSPSRAFPPPGISFVQLDQRSDRFAFSSDSKSPTTIVDITVLRTKAQAPLDGTRVYFTPQGGDGGPGYLTLKTDIGTSDIGVFSSETQSVNAFDGEVFQLDRDHRFILDVISESSQPGYFEWVYSIDYIDTSGDLTTVILDAQGQLWAEADSASAVPFTLSTSVPIYAFTYEHYDYEYVFQPTESPSDGS